MTPPSGDLTDVRFWEANYGPCGQTRPMPWRSRGDRAILRVLKRFLPPGRGRRALELGCGDSYWLPYFGRELGFDVAGIDYSPVRSARVERLLRSRRVPGEIRCGDFRDVPPGWEAAFDVVYSGGVIEHFERPDEILRVFARYVRPGGLLVTTVPNFTGLWGTVQRWADREVYASHRIFGLRDLRAFHGGTGLRLLHAAHLRWADPSVVNYSNWPPLLRKIAGGVCYYLNLGLGALDPLGHPPGRWLSSNLVSVASRPG